MARQTTTSRRSTKAKGRKTTLSPQEHKERVEQAREKLNQGVEALIASDSWAEHLKTLARFHTYSFNNMLLIALQCPGATRVMGYGNKEGTTGWKSLGRHVIKGQESIKIFGHPVKRTRTETDEDTGEQRQVTTSVWWPIRSVFDISQTEGEPLPLVTPKLLQGNGEALRTTLTGIEKQIIAKGYSFVRGTPVVPGANGSTDPTAKEVIVRDDVDDAHALKTAIHELAHIHLHDPDTYNYASHKGIAEVEADSVAFVVASVLGLDTSDYSFAYMAGWSRGDVEVVKKTGARVQKTAEAILEALETEGGGA